MNIVKKDNGKLRLNLSAEYMYDNFAMREDYDIILSCLGFAYDFSPFNKYVMSEVGWSVVNFC